MTFFKPHISWKKVWILYGIVFLFTYSINFSIDIFISYDLYYQRDFFYYMKFNLPLIIITSFVNIIVVIFLNNTFLNKYTLSRLLVGLLFVIILDFIQLLYFQMIGSDINIYERLSSLFENNYIYSNSVQNYLSLLFAEFIYFSLIKQTQEINIEKIMLENERYKYNQLKNQINPHFLFNSLNILSAMVYTREPKESANYIGKLSDVYRYVLLGNEKSIITLREEIEFINKYGDILRTRFGKGFILDINLNENSIEKSLPFMSLQLLIENAVKHNIASENKPLIIKIYTEDEYVVVENNINIRNSRLFSTGIGLKNLSQRFRIASKKDIIIIKESSIFKVKLPLI